MPQNTKIRDTNSTQIVLDYLGVDDTEETVMRCGLCTMSQNLTQEQILNNTQLQAHLSTQPSHNDDPALNPCLTLPYLWGGQVVTPAQR